MGENTKIAWCDHTFHPVRWGPSGTRVVAAESAWKKVERWDTIAKITSPAGGNHLNTSVFCGSQCDVCEDWQGEMLHADGTPARCSVNNRSLWIAKWDKGEYEDASYLTTDDVRARLFRLIDATRLTWLLLTKRPQNIRPKWCSHVNTDGKPPSMLRRDNVWLGTSIACQEDADKNIPELLKCRDLCAGLFLSIEPLIVPVDLITPAVLPWLGLIDQVIIGGESGPHARPCNVEWIRSIARQCGAAGVSCFVKQLGSVPVVDGASRGAYREQNNLRTLGRIRDKKGGDQDEWPEDLRQYRSLAWKGGA